MKWSIATSLVALAALSISPAAGPRSGSMEVEAGIPLQASAGGKYTGLLKVLHVPTDKATYGEHKDFGQWAGNAYAGYTDLPPGFWVYAYPKWYIWKSPR